ncbi:hypothetical protein PQR64_35220 [Paraburkholderia phytofirmans]|uniref:hypothetical protein n=1 Tax=Paraburkholderia phytofirmans TaxID=261302 RepID=UPI0038BCEEA7
MRVLERTRFERRGKLWAFEHQRLDRRTPRGGTADECVHDVDVNAQASPAIEPSAMAIFMLIAALRSLTFSDRNFPFLRSRAFKFRQRFMLDRAP